MKNFIMALAAMLAVAGCTDPKRATKALEGMGYTNITITGYSVFGCSDSEAMRTGFVATDQRGNRVTGTFCSGVLFKGGVVRLN